MWENLDIDYILIYTQFLRSKKTEKIDGGICNRRGLLIDKAF